MVKLDPDSLAKRPIPPEWRLNEIVRRRRLREDASRDLGINLAEGLALSEFLARFTGVLRR